jgi:G6PDH family F420-dependent oxidoreductase
MPGLVEIGYFLSSEEHGPRTLLDQARAAEEAGMGKVWISDHFHPWLEEQGESPFVWSVIGAIAAATDLHVTTAVTCPTVRMHPAIVAHAAATAAVLSRGRFTLGVGSGEALNEHITAQHWPPAPIRLEMLDEAIAIMRRLFTGDVVDHRGKHFTVESARLFTVPDEPPPIIVSAFGRRAATLAATAGDGLACTFPSEEILGHYASAGGTGLKQAGVKVCWGPDREACTKVLHRVWRQSGLPGQLSQDLPTWRHFDQASELVTPEALAEKIPCGPDPEPYLEAFRAYRDVGFDELYVTQVGDDQRGFLEFFGKEIEPAL